MAASVGVHAHIQGTTSTLTLTTPGVATQATGSTFLGSAIAAGASNISSVQDNKTNAYSQIQTSFNTSFGSSMAWYRKENGLGGAGHTFTSTLLSGQVQTVYFDEVLGAATSSVLDQSVVFVGDASSPFTTNTTGTTTQADEIAFAFYGTDTPSGTETITWGNGFTQIDADGNSSFVTGGIAFKVLSATGTVQGSITSSVATDTAGAVLTFKALASAPTDPPQNYFQDEVDDYNQFEDFQGFQDAPLAIDNDMAVTRVELPDATEDPIIDDEALYPSYWAQPPPNDDLPQQSTVIDADEQPEDPDEDFGFSDVQSQAPVIIADQIYAECSDNQLDDADEPYEVAEYPLAGDVQSNQVFVEDASGVFEEPDEPYDNFDYQPVDFASDQGSLFEDASNQPEDVDEDFAFFAAPIAVDVTAADQFSTVDDASTQLEDFDEPFDTVDSPLSDNQVIQSNQVFVDDAADQLEDFDDTYVFENVPLSADLPVAPNLHRLVMDVNTGRLGWIVSGTHAGSPILIQLLD